jgi:surface antigen
MLKRLTVAVFAAALAMTSATGTAHAESWQCAPFARFFSNIKIFGDAWTWWEQATGKYAKGFTPNSGAVLVFKPYGAMSRGHVAVVTQVLTDRIVQVTHANWSPLAGKRGQVEQDVTVVDVSANGDWSQVKVWYDPSGDLGRTVYPTYGFIYGAADAAHDMARNAVQSAADVFAGASAAVTEAVTNR